MSQLSAGEVRALAVKAQVDPRSVKRFLKGEPIRGMAAYRIQEALAGTQQVAVVRNLEVLSSGLSDYKSSLHDCQHQLLVTYHRWLQRLPKHKATESSHSLVDEFLTELEEA